MLDFLLLSLLISHQHFLSCWIIHCASAAFCFAETLPSDLLSVYERKHDAVGKNRTKLFHQIKSKAGPTWSVTVQKPDCWVEAYRFQCGGDVVCHKSVNEGKQRIHVIERRPATSFPEEKISLLGSDKMIEYFKVSSRRVSLASTYDFQA